jgi:serine/threonine-protein kinase
VAAAAGGFVLWTQHPRAQQKPAETQVAAVTPAAPPAAPVAAPAPAKAAEPAPEDTGTPPATAQLAPTDAGTAVATATPEDAGTPAAQGAAPAVVLAGGTAPATPGGSVVPASGTAPATPPAAASTATPEAPQAAITTRLQLVVLPPVEVSLDGKRLGKTPLAMPLAPGTYTFELSNPAKGINKTTRAITVRPQGTTVQRFLVGKGTVLVRAPAGSRIFLNGRKAGPKLSLFEGEHQLVVTTGKARWEKSFRLEPRQRVTFDVKYDKP